jgi:16S rRNA A1518/A1519 N6-dimethyltransferase RsmA/KsgA/DIM1 with predicted DNA glycosylase/AP lyase activity
MTAEALARGARVDAFEIDPGFSAVLREIFGAERRFRLREGGFPQDAKSGTGRGETRPDPGKPAV